MKQIFINLIQDKLSSYLQSDAYVIKVMNNQIEDERTRNLFKFLINYHSFLKDTQSLKSPKSSGKINLRNISKESEHFPKCMKNIYETLEKGEKLSHNQRFNFSLFLKDIGMQIQDATSFWHKYYSRIHGQTSRSLSIWEERKSKYSYSVKHLYGEAGSRRRYKTATCSSLHSQSLCPFSNTDIEELAARLNQPKKVTHDDNQDCNLNSQVNGSCVACCSLYEQESRQFSSPLHLYAYKKESKHSEASIEVDND